jgi:hypothetical protein
VSRRFVLCSTEAFYTIIDEGRKRYGKKNDDIIIRFCIQYSKPYNITNEQHTGASRTFKKHFIFARFQSRGSLLHHESGDRIISRNLFEKLRLKIDERYMLPRPSSVVLRMSSAIIHSYTATVRVPCGRHWRSETESLNRISKLNKQIRHEDLTKLVGATDHQALQGRISSNTGPLRRLSCKPGLTN